MLATIILWAYISFLGLVYGVALSRFICGVSGRISRNELPFVMLIIIGLNVMAWLASILSFVFSMGWFSQTFIVCVALALFVLVRKDLFETLQVFLKEKNILVWLMMVVGVLVALVYGVKSPSNPDTVLYHAQAIHWAEKYPVIPGLGNIDARLGASSNWFLINALFSFSFLTVQSFRAVPSLLFLLSFLYFLGGAKQILLKNIHVSDVAKVIFIPFMIYVGAGEISSPGTDLPVILLYWLAICVWLELIEKTDSTRLQLALLVLSVSTITFKMSGIPVLLFALWILYENWRKHNYQSLKVHIVIMAAIIVPWMIRAFILSGYWLYPEPMMSVIGPSVDWRIPLERVVSFKAGVYAWAISPGLRPDDIASLSKIEQYRRWFFELTQNQKVIVTVAISFPLLTLIFSLLLSKIRNVFEGYWVIFTISCLSLMFWLFTAPSIRFGYGYLLGSIAVIVAPLLHVALKIFDRYQKLFALLVVTFLFIQQLVVITTAFKDGTRYMNLLVLPADYPQVATTACDLGNTTIQCARNWRMCSYNSFPCAPVPVKNVEMRGDSFQDGFRPIVFDKP